MGYGSGPTAVNATPGATVADGGALFSKFGVTDLVTFAIPTLSLLEVSLLGRLFVSELLLVALLPFLLIARGHQLSRPFPKVFLALTVAWLISQVATDLYRDIPSSDYLRGWAKILFTGFCFTSIYLLINNRRERIVLYLMGMVAGTVLDVTFTPSNFAAAQPWSSGHAFPVTYSVFIFAVIASHLHLLPGRAWSAQLAAVIGLRLGGRQEILTSSRAVQESPTIGQGSRAKDPELTYHYAVFEHRRRTGYDAHGYVATDLQPTHSRLFGAWVESGIVGGVFWKWILTLVARALAVLYRGDEQLTPILVIIAFLLLWDIPFSPFGAELLFTTTFFIIAMMWTIDRAGTALRQDKSSA